MASEDGSWVEERGQRAGGHLGLALVDLEDDAGRLAGAERHSDEVTGRDRQRLRDFVGVGRRAPGGRHPDDDFSPGQLGWGLARRRSASTIAATCATASSIRSRRLTTT